MNNDKIEDCTECTWNHEIEGETHCEKPASIECPLPEPEDLI